MSAFVGFFLGIIITLATEIYILQYFYYKIFNKKNNNKTDINEKVNNENTKEFVEQKENKEITIEEKETNSDTTDKEVWPPKIVEYLENCLFPQYNDKSNPPTECCTWVNVVFARFFLELRHANDFKERMKKKLNDKFSRKLKNNTYIQSVFIRDIDFGDVSPYFNGVRVKKSSSEKLEVNLEMEMEYSGAPNSLSINIDIKLVKGIIIPVKIKILKCNGTLLIVVPYLKDPTLFGITFVNNPNPEFSIEVLSNRFNNKKKYLLTPIFSVINKLLKSYFVEYWTLPAIRTFDLPLVAPRIPIYVYISEDNKIDNTSIQPPIQSTKRNINNQKSLDIILDKTFPLHTHVSSKNALLFNEKLTSTFLYLAKENNNDIYKLLEKRQSVDQSPLVYEFWKTIKNKHGIHVQKKLINEFGERGCIFKGTFVVRMNPKNVYEIITNMSNEANVYIFNDTFMSSSVVKRFNDDTLVRHISFKLNRQQSHGYILFEAHKEINDDQDEDNFDQILGNDKTLEINNNEKDKQTKYVIVWRSIAGIKNDDDDEILIKNTNINSNNLNLNKKRSRSFTINDLADKMKIMNANNMQEVSEEEEQKQSFLTINSSLKKSEENKQLLSKTDSFLRRNQSTDFRKEHHISPNSYHSMNSLSDLNKCEIESGFDNLKEKPLFSNKIVQSPSMTPKEVKMKKDDSFRSHKSNKSNEEKDINISELIENKRKEGFILDNLPNLENSDNEQLENLDLMVTSSKDDIVSVENFKVKQKSSGMFKISLSDDEELMNYDNYLNSNRSDSSTSSLASLSEKYEDTYSEYNNNGFDLSSKKDNEKIGLLDVANNSLSNNSLLNEKNLESTLVGSKSINSSEIKSSYHQDSLKDNYLSDNNENNNKNELFENINVLFIKGFYLESQLGDPESCYLTVISQFERSFKKFEATYDYCRKLKKYLEDHNAANINYNSFNNNINSNNSYNNNNNNNNYNNNNTILNDDEKKKSFGRSLSSENIAKLGKIKNYLSNGLVKVKRSHTSMRDANKPSMLKHDSLNSNRNKTDTLNSNKLKCDTINSDKFKDENIMITESTINDSGNENNENINNEINVSPIKYSSFSNNEECSRSIPVPPISSMPNTTATVNNQNNNKKGVIKIFKKVQKVVTKRGSQSNNNGSIDEHNSHKYDESSNQTSNLYLSDNCHSTDSVVSLDEKETHTKNNIVVLKHVNKPNVPLNNQNFTNQFINNKETIRVESQHPGGEIWNDLRFEFNEAKNLPLDFSISFKPNIISSFDRWKHIYNESSVESGVFVIVPSYTCNTSQTLKIINGCISIYNFPPGIFILKWENNARKTAKHISFRFAIQPVTILCFPQKTLSQYCNEYNSVINIKQRSCGTFSLPYIALNEQCYKSIGISGRTAFLNYQIYTKGNDIQFGIIYESIQENNMNSPDLHHQSYNYDSLNVKKLSAYRKASSYSNILSEEHLISNENILEDCKFKYSEEILNSNSPKAENGLSKPVNENENIVSNEIHSNNGGNNSKDIYELKPNQRFVVPITKYNSHKNVLNGTIPISNKFGIYTFVFNNSFSIVTSKSLELNIKLLIL
ncbi:hypothetical protein BCR32DRAFT_297130 [Anaeromyces robustus]|uniref:SMP-LTD domain-containing protein n=1 Tax=Anaeromyces robustus TaxID=1754192 RepID=A0A1Y1WNF7_9FUNG|nr:hypothetical protein BCR32DRAFT_297130 [Anaeromyces robustus]|eukprot:ORX75081.1 hypothetical protein BCR32DRAFT_297130 [Anaeromyces robustus]